MRPRPRPDPVTSATAPLKLGVCAVAELLNWDTPVKAARGIREKRGGLSGCHHKPLFFYQVYHAAGTRKPRGLH
jgi:hypothetical protein